MICYYNKIEHRTSRTLYILYLSVVERVVFKTGRQESVESRNIMCIHMCMQMYIHAYVSMMYFLNFCICL